jgi:putative SOS response-associated peptidase YedK
MRKDAGLLYFAAIYDVWHGPGGVQVAQVATITCPPSADVRDIHHRMGAILDEDQLDQWLSGDEQAAKALLQTYPDGTLKVEKADDVDWQGP